MPIRVNSEILGPAGQKSFRLMEQGLPRRLDQPGDSIQQAGESQGTQPGFAGLVNDFVSDVNSAQMEAGNLIQAFVAGEVTDVHQVMVVAEEAGLALDLLLEIRNRAQDAFQEIMRMQI